MPTMFDKYDDNLDDATVTAQEQICKANKRLLKKKDRRAIKSLTKAIRQQNKLIEQEAERRRAEEAMKSEKFKTANGAGCFLSKLGDAVCKAVPKILTTIVTLAFGWFVKAKFDKQIPQAT